MQGKDTRRPFTRSTAGVYFICGAGLVKIGIVKASWSGCENGVAQRFRQIQGGSPAPLVLHRFMPCDNPGRIERSLHARFAEQRHHGEWFDAVILDYVDGQTDDQIITAAIEFPGPQGALFQ